MKNYKELTEIQRYQIAVLLTAEHSQKEIAEHVGVSRATISREARRNQGLRVTDRCLGLGQE